MYTHMHMHAHAHAHACTRTDRKFYESLSLEEKRKLYKCGRDYVTLDKVETWDETSSNSE